MILLTRPEPAASRSARRFAALGHEVVVAPLMEAVPLTPDGLPAPGPGKALALTSARAVEAITGTPALARDWRDLAHLPVYAVGESTADAAALPVPGRACGAGNAGKPGGPDRANAAGG